MSEDLEYSFKTFTYPEKQDPVLKDIYFNLEQGSTLGIVGKTGSGKTTLFRLLLREYDLEKGSIKIGDISIYDFKLEKLRSAIGYVPQDHFLFSATIAENIAFANPEATLEEINNAAKVAAIHDDITQFNEKYGTFIGERGVTLSGGKKQRISIARALSADSELLVLDDALSAVDAKTEEKILINLKENRKNKTTLIATHRLSAIQHADLILVLHNGKIVERGNHQELIAKNGLYYNMYRLQQGTIK